MITPPVHDMPLKTLSPTAEVVLRAGVLVRGDVVVTLYSCNVYGLCFRQYHRLWCKR